MEQTLVHLAETAAWLFFIMFVLAIVGVIAIVRWIIAMVTGAEHAVVSEAESIESKLHRN